MMPGEAATVFPPVHAAPSREVASSPATGPGRGLEPRHGSAAVRRWALPTRSVKGAGPSAANPPGCRSNPSVSEDPRIGSEIAGYRVERLIGRGGMSVVYL